MRDTLDPTEAHAKPSAMFGVSGGRRGTSWLLAAIVATAGRAAGAQAQPAPDRYRIEASLDPQHNSVRGQEVISWTNRSTAPLASLFFHLYANAFAGERTVFMREHGERLRGTALSRRGGIEVTALRAQDGTDLLARAHTDLEHDDATQMRVDLPAPLAPGARIELHVSFRVQLPSIVARMGGDDDFFMIAQWFPKLAKLEPDGRWASFPYHGLGEFYADFADYELSVRVPRAYVVAAPGDLLGRTEQPDGTRVERYLLARALDVAWAAYPRFRTHADASGPVRVEVFASPGHAALAAQQAALLHAGIARLGRNLGAYPYARLVLVLPPPNAIGAAGMEYPGLVVGWPVSWATELDPVERVMLDVVTAHELAHEWFAITLASNETEAPLLDEGLAEWSGLDLLRERYGRSYFQRWLGLPIDLFELHRAAYARAAAPPSSLEPAYAYRPEELGLAVYVRPALAFESIARSWGLPRLQRTLAAYALAQRFGHPQLTDLWAAFDRGYWPGFAREVLAPALEGAAFDTRLERGAAPAAALSAQRGVEHGLPATVEVVDARGEQRLSWPAGAVALALPARAQPLLGARIDPDRDNLLDRARGDDQLRANAAAPESPLLARLLLWAQALLAGLGP